MVALGKYVFLKRLDLVENEKKTASGFILPVETKNVNIGHYEVLSAGSEVAKEAKIETGDTVWISNAAVTACNAMDGMEEHTYIAEAKNVALKD